MPYGRQTRLDRRRRVFRDGQMLEVLEQQREAADPRRKKAARRPAAEAEADLHKRLTGYSQDVRHPCQLRVMQLVPVRRWVYSAWVAITLAAASLLIFAHYFVWIAGSESLQSSPLALMLDVRSRVGLAGWINIQLWMVTALFCWLIYEVRKYRLDDYRAHYRIWLWLATASVLGSLEAGTGLTQTVIASIDRFARVYVGWSGEALMEGTIAAVVGMVALRVLTELRGSPTSQVMWLAGVLLWGTSLALSSRLFKSPFRADYLHLFVGSSWLLGKVIVMLAACTYLRNVYVAAQKRFISRSDLLPPLPDWRTLLRRRAKETEAEATETPARKSRKKSSLAAEPITPAPVSAISATSAITGWRAWIPTRIGRPKPSTEKLGSSANRSATETSPESKSAEPRSSDRRVENNQRLEPARSVATKPEPARPAPTSAQPPVRPAVETKSAREAASTESENEDESKPKKSKWKWRLPTVKVPKLKLPSLPKRKPKVEPAATSGDDISKKVAAPVKPVAKPAETKTMPIGKDAPNPAGTKRGWFSFGRSDASGGKSEKSTVKTADKTAEKPSVATKPAATEKAKDAAPKEKRSWMSRLPKLPSLSALKLQPPEPTDVSSSKPGASGANSRANTSNVSGTPAASQPTKSGYAATSPPQDSSRPLPSTRPAVPDTQAYEDGDDDDYNDGSDPNRRLSKAERKRLKRQQDGRRAA